MLFFLIPICFVFQYFGALDQPQLPKFTLGDPNDQDVKPQGPTKSYFLIRKCWNFICFCSKNAKVHFCNFCNLQDAILTNNFDFFTSLQPSRKTLKNQSFFNVFWNDWRDVKKPKLFFKIASWQSQKLQKCVVAFLLQKPMKFQHFRIRKIRVCRALGIHILIVRVAKSKLGSFGLAQGPKVLENKANGN